MSKVWMLTKVLLKTNFLSGIGDSKKKKSSKAFGWIGIGLLLLFVVLSLGVPIIYGIDSVLEVVPMYNILLSVILPLAGITTIVFSLFSVVSVFYMSKDIEHLLPLPLKARDIMLSKFIVSLVNEYYILFMFILPCLIGVGIGIDASILYYVYMVIVFLFLPIIPSVIVTFLILLMTKFTGVLKNKDLFTYISMGLILLFSFGYNYIVQNVISVDLDNIGTTLQSLESEVLPYFRGLFPFYNSAVAALVNFDNPNGLFALVSFLGINFIFLLVIYCFGDKLYLRSLTTNNGSKKTVENIDRVLGSYNEKKQSSFVWLLKKEWLIIKRSPIFMLNIVIIVLLMPVIILFSMGMVFVSEGMQMNLMVEDCLVQMYLKSPFIYCIVMAVCLFFTSTSLSASTSISREGKSAWVMKIIPVSYFKQVNVKVLFAVILDMLGAILVAIVPIILFKIPFYYVICLFAPLLIIVILLNYINIYIDLKNPKLKWDEENVAVKQNFNGFISMLVSMGVCAIFGVIGALFYWYNIEINVILLSLIISVISGLLLGVVIFKFYKKNDNLLDSID